MADLPAEKRKKHRGKALGLTEKQQVFVREYKKHGNATKAAMVAYDVKNEKSAGVVGYKTLDAVQESFPQVLERVGLSDERLAKTLVDALGANKTYFDKGEGKRVSEPDHFMRVKSAEVGFKLKGRFPKNEEQAEQTFNFVISRGDDVPIKVDGTAGQATIDTSQQV